MDKSRLYHLIAEKNRQRFQNHQKYNIEKILNDDFVSKAIMNLALEYRDYLKNNLQFLIEQNNINIADIGPAHGSIGTCYLLLVLDEFNLIEKVSLTLIDPVKEVIEDNINLNFPILETIELIYRQLEESELTKTKKEYLIEQVSKIFRNAIGIIANIQDVSILGMKEAYDAIICTFALHHIHPDHKTQALQKTIKLLKPKGVFAFADEWFGEQYFERFLLGHNHILDPIPFEFPESPEDLLKRLRQKISLNKLDYDNNEAFSLFGYKRIPENITKTGNFPIFD
jgi:SAM-dependent methyltransferase